MQPFLHASDGSSWSRRGPVLGVWKVDRVAIDELHAPSMLYRLRGTNTGPESRRGKQLLPEKGSSKVSRGHAASRTRCKGDPPQLNAIAPREKPNSGGVQSLSRLQLVHHYLSAIGALQHPRVT